ncbi:hypothetical protein [Sporomusa sp.]|nr:hypothetical protein [Sporomusa sp.]HWR42446.1 hypothetical protein [Sporomusa sp.]
MNMSGVPAGGKAGMSGCSGAQHSQSPKPARPGETHTHSDGAVHTH